MISIEKNVLNNINFVKIDNLIKDHKFNYSLNYKANVLHMYHTFYFNGKIISPFAHIINPLIKFLDKPINNAMLVLVPKTIDKKNVFKKIDGPFEIKNTVSCVYFLNTNDGNFNIFGFGDILPEQNKIFTYDSNLEVENYSCTDDIFKAYIQLDYYKGTMGLKNDLTELIL